MAASTGNAHTDYFNLTGGPHAILTGYVPNSADAFPAPPFQPIPNMLFWNAGNAGRLNPLVLGHSSVTGGA